MIPLRDSLPSRRFPVVTVALIAVNLLVFLYQGYLSTQTEVIPSPEFDRLAWFEEGLVPPPLLRGERSMPDLEILLSENRSRGAYVVQADDVFVTQYALIAGELLSGKDLPPTSRLPIWAMILTSMFLHGSIMHLVGNMLYLWIFGDNVEEAMGRVRFLIFYLLCGAAAAVTQIAVDPSSTVPMLGASGAIAGVLAAYFVLFPQSRVLTLVPIFFFIRLISVPAVFFLGFWFALQLISGAGAIGDTGGVAWWAHIGGFMAGALLVVLFRRRHVPLRLLHMFRGRR